MYAWRKASVDRLNLLAREHWREAGRLSGPEIVAGARRYAADDRVVTLAPGERGKLVTSERGVVLGADPDVGELVLRMEDERAVHLMGEELGAYRLAHGYATTVRRAQGATVELGPPLRGRRRKGTGLCGPEPSTRARHGVGCRR
jgi:hypothetical protein